jgi:predicted nucleotidyltransferase
MTMQITNLEIAGFSAVKVRDALRIVCGSDSFDAKSLFAKRLQIADGAAITKAVIDAGYLEKPAPKFASRDGNIELYSLTERGRSFLHASAMTRMPRAKAEAILEGVLKRIGEVNAGPYVYSIGRAVVFGSFIRETEQTLGDLDIAVELESRFPDRDQRSRAEEGRRQLAETRGRQFSNITAWVCWPQQEVFKHLKARQPLLSLHSIDHLFDMARKNKAPVPNRVIFAGPVIFPV